VDIPESLRHVIDQQLEQLHPEERACLEMASVAGREFSAAAVAAGTDDRMEEMEARYAALARRGQFIQAGGTEAWPDGTLTARYGFTHDLYQQVAYQRLGAAQRVRLHRQLARHLETAYGPRASELTAELAWHCEQGQDYPRAIPYLQQAAATAARRYAQQEAIDYLQRALALLQILPDTPERHQDRAFLLEAHVALGGERFFLGQFDAALVHLQRGMAGEDVPAPSTARIVHHPRISCHIFASWVLWSLGYPDQALVHNQEALAQAQRLENPYILMWCQSLTANLHILRGEAAAAQQLAEASVALATTLEVPFWGARSTFMRGIALTRQGCTAEGLEQMQEG
jgi:tetratricopeptide (TPR) repeat protein